MKKKIKGSMRGLTFSLDEGTIAVGSHYRYVIDKNKQQIWIIMDEDGKLQVSRKKSGKHIKPLFDLRSQEVKEIVSKAAYLEVEVKKDHIIVSTFQKYRASILDISDRIWKATDILGEKTGEIVIPAQMVAGAEHIDYTAFSCDGKMDQRTLDSINPNISKVYNVISLFSGAGLFDWAWKKDQRVRFVYASDFDPAVIDTYRYNIGDHIVCKDIRDITSKELPPADIFLASPCCQCFSNANRKKQNMTGNTGEQKRLLIDEVIRLARDKRPKVIVIENVPQFLTRENGLYLNHMVEGLTGYDISTAIVNDAECGGYSFRKRCIVIASRIGKIKLPEVKCLSAKTVRDALKKVDATWYNYKDVTLPSEQTKEKMSYVPAGGNWRDIPPEIGKYGPNTQSNIMRRLEWDKPSITLSNFRKSNILHPEEHRILSVAEAAAIMGLDKEFRFISKSLSAMQQMVCNGVTQAISKFVKNVVLKFLKDFHFHQKMEVAL